MNKTKIEMFEQSSELKSERREAPPTALQLQEKNIPYINKN